MIDKIALTLFIIGGLNWGCVGIFLFALVAWICGGQTGIISRIVYILVALAAIWCISLLFRDTDYVSAVNYDSVFRKSCLYTTICHLIFICSFN